MKILAIDPGPTQSAWVLWDAGKQKVESCAIEDNDTVLRRVHCPHDFGASHLVIEFVESFGKAVGKEVFETVFWVGRFWEAWFPKESACRVYRKEVKMHFCGSMRAKDANIRRALLDRFGPQRTKLDPGRLYGIKSHLWSALAVAVLWHDSQPFHLTKGVGYFNQNP